MRSWIIAPLLLVAAIAPGKADPVGFAARTVPSPERRADLDVGIWYPGAPGGTPAVIGATPIFEGVAARRDPPIVAGHFPLILLAHGGLRAAPNLTNWLAADLAARGMIVATVPPPRLAEGEAAAALRETWLRPLELSRILSAILEDAAFGPRVASDRIAVVGFLRGGTSALALAGARFDPARVQAFCETPIKGPAAEQDCGWFARHGVAPHAADPNQLARDFRDPRIVIAIAIDPELADRFSRASLGEIAIPVSIINLGTVGAETSGLDGAALARLIPGAQFALVPRATPFSAFSLCAAGAGERLAAEGDAMAICQETAAERSAMHQTIADLIAHALARHTTAKAN